MQPADMRPTDRRLGSVRSLAAIGLIAAAAIAPGLLAERAGASVPLAALRAAAAGGEAEVSSAAPVAAVRPERATEPATFGSAPPTRSRPPDAVASVASDRSLSAPVGTEQVGPVMPEADANAPLQFIVKFEDAVARRWVERYVADPNGARTAFAEQMRGNSAYAGLRLVRMNNSGEATLEFEGAAPPIPAVRRELASDIVRRLNAAEGVEYAETNLVGLRENEE